MRFVVLCAIAILSFPPASVSAQDPAPKNPKKAAKPDEAGEPTKQQFGMLKVENPDPSLHGDEFKDEEWGFAIRLPAGFKAIDPAQLEATRRALIPPEADRVLPSGNIQKKQIFIFDDGKGGRMLIEAYDPPLQISTPVQLRNLILGKARDGGLRIDESGKPLQFQARGGRVGSLTEFDMQQQNGPIIHQLVTAIRAGARSFLIYASSEREKFMGYEKTYQQALTTIGLRADDSEAGEQIAQVESRRFEGKRAALMIAFNLAILIGVLYACSKLRRSAPELASEAA